MEGFGCKSDEVLYYFKEVVIFGLVYFIFRWIWIIVFYVFLFFGFVFESGGMIGDSVRGGRRYARGAWF